MPQPCSANQRAHTEADTHFLPVGGEPPLGQLVLELGHGHSLRLLRSERERHLALEGWDGRREKESKERERSGALDLSRADLSQGRNYSALRRIQEREKAGAALAWLFVGDNRVQKKKKNRAQGRRDITGCWIGTPPEAIYSFEDFFFTIIFSSFRFTRGSFSMYVGTTKSIRTPYFLVSALTPKRLESLNRALPRHARSS